MRNLRTSVDSNGGTLTASQAGNGATVGDVRLKFYGVGVRRHDPHHLPARRPRRQLARDCTATAATCRHNLRGRRMLRAQG